MARCVGCSPTQDRHPTRSSVAGYGLALHLLTSPRRTAVPGSGSFKRLARRSAALAQPCGKYGRCSIAEGPGSCSAFGDLLWLIIFHHKIERCKTSSTNEGIGWSCSCLSWIECPKGGTRRGMPIERALYRLLGLLPRQVQYRAYSPPPPTSHVRLVSFGSRLSKGITAGSAQCLVGPRVPTSVPLD